MKTRLNPPEEKEAAVSLGGIPETAPTLSMDVSTRKERRRGDFLPGHEGATRRESNNEVGAALGLSTSDTTCRMYLN